MNREERPIVFTITQVNAIYYKIYTKDNRANLQTTISYKNLFPILVNISKAFNDQGYAVLFEVD